MKLTSLLYGVEVHNMQTGIHEVFVTTSEKTALEMSEHIQDINDWDHFFSYYGNFELHEVHYMFACYGYFLNEKGKFYRIDNKLSDYNIVKIVNKVAHPVYC